MTSGAHRLVVAAVVLGLFAAGCSAGERGATKTLVAPPVAGVATVPEVVDAAPLELPVSEYLLEPGEQAALVQAQTELIDRCMRRFGLSAPPMPSSSPPADGPTRTERRYGMTDPELAASSGYHLPGMRPPAAQPPPPITDDENLALLGSRTRGATLNGEAVPEDGCVGESVRTLGGDAGNAELASTVDVESVVLARKDVRVREAFDAWSACMAQSGFDYATPWDPPNDQRFAGPEPTDEERAVAVADVECKRTTNVVGAWFAVDVALQEAMIEHQRAAFDEVAAAYAERLDTAVAALAER